MRRALGMVLIAVLVVLAGCSGVLGGGGGEPTETVTPAAVPTDEPTPTPVPRLAPGLTRQGIENASALIGAHTSLLQNRSFTQKSNTTGVAQNGSSLFQTISTSRSGPAGEKVYTVSERNGSYGSPSDLSFPVRTEVWANDERLFRKRTYANGTATYDRFEQRYGASGAGLIYLLEPFGTANTSVTTRERNGTTLYLVQGESQGESAFRQGNVSLRLLVDSRGLIHSYRTVREIPSDESLARVVSETRISKVGATDAPERPSWVGEAMNRTTSVARNGTETPM
jgi:hypothetical protein